MQPDPQELIESLGLESPLVGFYDPPDVAPFEPVVRPAPGKTTCIFAFYRNWMKGDTLCLTPENFGCRGAGSCLLSVPVRSTEELVAFLVEGEGLRKSRELMRPWVERRRTHQPEFGHVVIGPLRRDQYAHLKAVTFYVNPDQLSALVVGAHYNSGPDSPPPVVAPFGSGCMQLLPDHSDRAVPQAVIGGTDITMRHFLPPDTLAFTVNKPMFRQLCELDVKSFLHKHVWRELKDARELV
ncbi:MAG TPA: DUF169 domain-containing protein [Candidatus Saccharimonadales bacterium]|nr:DUF169 domain-containing protein [Candidatus Saccharimonadales bacterium]